MLSMVRCRGCALDHLAAMIFDEQAEGFTMGDLYSHLKGSETSRYPRTRKSCQQRAGKMLRRKAARRLLR